MNWLVASASYRLISMLSRYHSETVLHCPPARSPATQMTAISGSPPLESRLHNVLRPLHIHDFTNSFPHFLNFNFLRKSLYHAWVVIHPSQLISWSLHLRSP